METVKIAFQSRGGTSLFLKHSSVLTAYFCIDGLGISCNAKRSFTVWFCGMVEAEGWFYGCRTLFLCVHFLRAPWKSVGSAGATWRLPCSGTSSERTEMRTCESTEKMAKKILNLLDVYSLNSNERSDSECWQQSASISPGFWVKLFQCGRNNLETLI